MLPRTVFESMRTALRNAPAVRRDAAFPRAWWQHLAAHGQLGLGFDADGHGARADWAAISSLSGLIARETACLGLALAWLAALRSLGEARQLAAGSALLNTEEAHEVTA